MNKQDFLNKLKAQLQKFGIKNSEDYLNYYSEYLDDLIENGATESEAVEKIGGVKKVLVEIISDNDVEIPQAKDRLKSILLIGSLPVWGPILAAVYIILIALLLAIAFCSLAFIVMGVWTFLGSFVVIFKTSLSYAGFQFGVALLLIGLSLLLEQLFVASGKKLLDLNKFMLKKFSKEVAA